MAGDVMKVPVLHRTLACEGLGEQAMIICCQPSSQLARPSLEEDTKDVFYCQVDPHCTIDHLRTAEASPNETPSSTPGDVSVAGEAEMEMKFPFADGQAWASSMPEAMPFDRMQAPHSGASNNGWMDGFLQWDAHLQDSTTSASNMPQSGMQRSNGSIQPTFVHGAPDIDGQPLLELRGGGVPTSNSGPSMMPFSFGQQMSAAPAFDFTSPAAMISPIVPHDLPFQARDGTSSHSPIIQRGQPFQARNDVSSHSPTGSSHGNGDGSQNTRVMDGHTTSQSHNGAFNDSPTSNHARIGTSESTPSSPDAPNRTVNAKKRKSEDIEGDQGDTAEEPIKKTAHNMIEKRYRTNLNDKIAALRDSVPSLRVMSRHQGNDDEEDEVDLEGLAPAHKLNKATVLSKATEYIRHLEKRNKKLQNDLDALKKQMSAYEKMAMNPFAYPGGVSTPGADGMPRYENPYDVAASQPGVPNSVQGMIPIPEDIRNMRQNTVMQPAYGTPTSYPPYSGDSRHPTAGQRMVHGRGSTFVNKMMVGSLAGLMVFEGLSEREKSGEEPEARGLFALPVSLLSEIGRFLWPRSLLLGAPPYEAIALLKLCLVIGALVYVLLPLLELKWQPKRKQVPIPLSPVPAIASPIETRRKAWLTAIQTVWVPQHQFVLEAAALLLKTLKLSTRKLIGWPGYAFVWNVTKEQEAARVKAWDIALDSQLTGGDEEISVSRLVLTLLASGTLPDTPSRLMLKALHIRVLLWEVAKAGYGTWYMFDELSMKLARRYWNQARLQHQVNTNRPSQRNEQTEEDELPAHLDALLRLDCDEVLVQPIIQRAYNLAWNRPSSENVIPDESTDTVVGDFAISSPLDALAAWYSSLVINQVLEHSLLLDSSEVIEKSLEVAIAIAPPNSAIQARALVAKAILTKDDRLELVKAAYESLPEATGAGNSADSDRPSRLRPLNVIPTTPVSADVPVALVLLKCLALAENHGEAGHSHLDRGRQKAVEVLLTFRPTETSFTLLSFVAAYRLLEHFVHDESFRWEVGPTLERTANAMRVWIGRDAHNPAVAALKQKIRMRVIAHCLSASKLLAGIRDHTDELQEESDAGYGSLEETSGEQELLKARTILGSGFCDQE